MIAREVAPDLHLALVLDSETSLVTVSDELAGSWGRDEDDLFERATANVVAAVPVEEARARVPAPLKLVSTSDDYTAAAAYLALPELVDGEALVMFATRFTCAILPLGEGLPGNAFEAMLAGTSKLYPHGNGALTPNLYWWRDEALEWIPIQTVSGMRLVMWPEGLDDLMTDRS